MARYNCANIRWEFDLHGVSVTSTDPILLEKLTAEVKELIPTCEVFYYKDVTDTNYGVLFAKLPKNRECVIEDRVGYWVLRRMGEVGWETFQVHSDRSYSLRKLD